MKNLIWATTRNTDKYETHNSEKNFNPGLEQALESKFPKSLSQHVRREAVNFALARHMHGKIIRE